MSNPVRVYSVEGVPLVKLRDHRAVGARELCDDIEAQASKVKGTYVPRDLLTASVAAGMAVLEVLDKEQGDYYANRSKMAMLREWFRDVPEDATGSDVEARIHVMIDGEKRDAHGQRDVNGVGHSMALMAETPPVGTNACRGVDLVNMAVQRLDTDPQAVDAFASVAARLDREHPIRLLFEALERNAQ